MGNYLTTARASTDAIGLNTAQSNVTWTANSSGLSLDARGYAGTATATTGNISITLNSGGLSLNAPAFLTTAMVSNASTQFVQANAGFAGTNASGTIASSGISISVNAGGGGVAIKGSGAQSQSTGTVEFANSNGITFGLSNNGTMTASHNGLTTAMQTGSQSQLWIMGNSSATIGGTNLSGTMYSNGLSLSVAAPGAAAENNWVNLLGANTAGNTTASGSTIGWSGQGVTLSGANGSQVVISAPGTSSLSGTGQVSISVNGSTISIGVPNPITFSGKNDMFLGMEMLAGQAGQSTVFIQPMEVYNPFQFDQVIFPMHLSNATNSSNSGSISVFVGLYTRNNSTLSLMHSSSSNWAWTASGTVGSYSIYGGIRQYPLGWTTTITEGNYWVGILSKTTTGGGAGMSWSQFQGSNMNSVVSGRWSSANNATNQWVLGMGSYSAQTASLPTAIPFANIRGSGASNIRPIIHYYASGTV